LTEDWQDSTAADGQNQLSLSPLVLRHCVVDFDARVAQWPGDERRLTATEVRLLAYLVSRDGRVTSRQDLLRDVWGYRRGVLSRTVKTTVGRLRAKIEGTPSRPEHLLTVVGAGYRFRLDPPADPTGVDAPPPQKRRTALGNASAACLRGPTVGRRAIRTQLFDLLASGARLVTVCGSPGIGKSHLAREVFAELVSAGGGEPTGSEAWVCETSQWTDLAQGIAEVLGTEPGPGRPLSTCLAARGSLWLLLDNFDSLAPGAIHAHELDRWLAACPQLRIVVTLCAPLGLAVEQRIEVPPLDGPASAELFRARAADPTLAGYADDRALASVVETLDGLPLAIEMAAGWASVLGPTELESRLQQQLHLLHSQRSDVGSHHASLRAAFQAAWLLLSPSQQSVLEQLSVFEGGFSLAAAEGVVDLVGDEPVLPVIQSLVRCALVRPLPAASPGGLAELRLLRAVRELASDGSARDEAQKRHVRWFANQARDEVLDSLECLGMSSPFAPLLEQRADLRAALDWAGRHRHEEQVVALGRLLLALERCRGPLLSCERLLGGAVTGLQDESSLRLLLDRAETLLLAGRGPSADQLLAAAEHRLSSRSGEPPAWERVRLAVLQARLAVSTGAEDAAALAREATELALTPRLRGWALTEYGVQLLRTGRGGEAAVVLEKAVELLRATGFRTEEARALEHLGRHALHRARPLRARSFFDSALALARDTGAREREAALLKQFAVLERLSGAPYKARQRAEEALAVSRHLGDRRGEAQTCVLAAEICGDGEEYARAQQHLDTALEIALQFDHAELEMRARLGMGELHLVLGRTTSARRQLSRAAQLAQALDNPRLLARSQVLLAELDYQACRVAEGRERRNQALRLLAEASLRSDLVDALQRAAAWETALGEHEIAELLMDRADLAAELSRADGRATLVGSLQ